MNIKIKTKSKIEKIAVTSFLYALGYNYCDESIEELLDKDSSLMSEYPDYPHIYVERGEFDSLDFCSSDHYTDETYIWATQFDKIVKALAVNKTFVLTDEYNAEIVEGGIQVGCQFIDFDTFDNLVEFVNNNR